MTTALERRLCTVSFIHSFSRRGCAEGRSVPHLGSVLGAKQRTALVLPPRPIRPEGTEVGIASYKAAWLCWTGTEGRRSTEEPGPYPDWELRPADGVGAARRTH